MSLPSLLADQETSLRRKIKHYKQIAKEIQTHLSKYPHDWGKFQSDFNMELNGFFRDIMNFEKRCLSKGDEAGVYKLKRLFINHLRQEFLFGDYIIWSLKKPFGYAGDFKIIDDIYRNDPETLGFGRLFDNYFQMSSISVAVRNRKEDFKKFIKSFAASCANRTFKILDLASGPCRDLKELFSTKVLGEEVAIVCYDQDERALDYAKSLLGDDQRHISFVKENVVRIALRKNIESQMPGRYDLIYSTGLFDYLDRRIATRLVENLRKLLNREGVLAISDVRDKYQNPSVHFMEWVGDWNLVYRSDEEFKQIFLDAGFKDYELQFASEQQGIMQYIFAKKLE